MTFQPTPKAVPRIMEAIKRFKPVFKTIQDRDVNEADTVTVVRDFIEAAFGYDKYTEITSEFAITAGNRVDLTIKEGDKIRVHVECKAVNVALRDTHVEQAITYAVKSGSSYAVLTNGAEWRVYRITNLAPLSYELVHSFNVITDVEASLVTAIWPLHKNGWERNILDQIYSHQKVLSKHNLAAIILSDGIVSQIRVELRRISKDVKVSEEQIISMLRDEVIKRDLTEGEEASKSKALVETASQVVLRRVSRSGDSEDSADA